MKKNQLTTTKSSAVILGRSKSLMNITKKILEGSNKGLVKANVRQDLTTHKDITIIGDLMWEKESRKMTWYEAMEYAENLRLGGYDDWRLPTPEELLKVVTLYGGQATTSDNDDWREIADKNIVNEPYQANYISKGFASNFYWSSTSDTGYSIKALYISFYDGSQNYYDSKSNSLYIRCVRAGQ